MINTIAATIMTCTSLQVVDGDTLRCDGQLLRLIGDGRPYVSGFDTPELRTYECEAEAILAKQARDRLSQLIEGGGYQIEDSGVKDRFDRPLVAVRLQNGRTAGAVLIEEGFAAVWTPDYEFDWCAD